MAPGGRRARGRALRLKSQEGSKSRVPVTSSKPPSKVDHPIFFERGVIAFHRGADRRAPVTEQIMVVISVGSLCLLRTMIDCMDLRYWVITLLCGAESGRGRCP